MSDIDLMLWLDLETNGDDVECCEVLEIGAFFTDRNLNKLNKSFHTVVRPTAEGLNKLFQNQYVVDMHAKSGLLTAIAEPRAERADNVKVQFSAWIDAVADEYGENTEIQLAGSGVASFDQQVLRYWYPPIFERLYYACFDVGHFRRFVESSSNEEVKALASKRENIAHRAMDDIEDHWIEAMRYMEWLGRVE